MWFSSLKCTLSYYSIDWWLASVHFSENEHEDSSRDIALPLCHSWVLQSTYVLQLRSVYSPARLHIRRCRLWLVKHVVHTNLLDNSLWSLNMKQGWVTLDVLVRTWLACESHRGMLISKAVTGASDRIAELQPSWSSKYVRRNVQVGRLQSYVVWSAVTPTLYLLVGLDCGRVGQATRHDCRHLWNHLLHSPVWNEPDIPVGRGGSLPVGSAEWQFGSGENLHVWGV